MIITIINYHNNYCTMILENGPVEIVSFPIKHADFPISYVNVYQHLPQKWRSFVDE